MALASAGRRLPHRLRVPAHINNDPPASGPPHQVRQDRRRAVRGGAAVIPFPAMGAIWPFVHARRPRDVVSGLRAACVLTGGK
jgi:hypothetical protein